MKRFIAVVLLISVFILPLGMSATALDREQFATCDNGTTEAILNELEKCALPMDGDDAIAQTGAAYAVSKVEITGVTVPKAGAKPVFSANVSSPEQCSIPAINSDSSDNTYMRNGITWADAATGECLTSSDVFTLGHEYMVLVVLYLNTGYYFSSSVTITVNGLTANSRVSTDNLQLAYAIGTFSCDSDSSYILGDADGNCNVESFDATFIQRYVANFPVPYKKAELMRGDVDNSGDLELFDVTYIQRYLCKLKTDYPIGSTITNDIPIASIYFSENTLTVNVGQSKRIKATVSPSNANEKALSWSSSDTSIATVDQSGNVTAVKSGIATINVSATDGSGAKASCSVIVVNPYVADADCIENFNKLVLYIRNNPTGTNRSGNPYISSNESGSEGTLSYSITALPSGALEFSHTSTLTRFGTTSSSTVTFVANFNNSFMISPNFSFSATDSILGYINGCNGSTSFDARYYNKNTKLSYSGLTYNENTTANSSTQLAFVDWNILLLTKVITSMDKIGFKSL